MEGLNTSDYKGTSFWKQISQPEDDEDEKFKFPLVMKPRRRGTSVGSAVSGTNTPGILGGSKTLSAQDLDRADEALSHHQPNGNGAQNGH